MGTVGREFLLKQPNNTHHNGKPAVGVLRSWGKQEGRDDAPLDVEDVFRLFFLWIK